MASCTLDSPNDEDRIEVVSEPLGDFTETNILENSMLLEDNEVLINEEMSSQRPDKRIRCDDSENLWLEVGRRGKMIARSSSKDDSMRVAQEQIEVSITSKMEPLPKQIGLARILKKENISNITKIKYINAYRVLLKLSDEESAEKLVSCKYFLEHQYRCQKTFEVGMSYGILRDIEKNLTEEEIVKELESSIPIINAKRLQRRNFENGKFEDSECIRLCFKGSSLPSHVFTYGLKVKVEPYIFPVTQCSRCWRYGHSYKTCAQILMTCPKCGKSHPNCESTAFRCVNCSGTHMALSKSCPVYAKERRIRELMAEFNCSFKRALTLYVPPSPQRDTAHVSQINNVSSHSRIRPTYGDGNKRSYADVLSTKADVHHVRESSPSSIGSARVSNSRSALGTKKVKNKTNRRQHNYEEDITSVEQCMIEEDEDTEKEKGSRKLDFKYLIQKIKEIIFMKRISFEKKLKSCSTFIYNWIINIIIHYLSEWPVIKSCFDGFFNSKDD